MNSEVVGGGRKSREHKRYLSIGESEASAVFNEEGEEGGDSASSRPGSRVFFSQQGRKDAAAAAAGDGREVGGNDHDERLRRAPANGKENVAGPPTREMRVFGGMTRLGPPSDKGMNGFGKGPDGSMYDGDGFLKELDAWLR